jgi:hypothetical protein
VNRHQSPSRRRFREFLVSVAVLHVTAIALYYALDVATAAPATQRAYAWTWMGVTVALVLVGVQRIKRARGRGRGGAGPTGEG